MLTIEQIRGQIFDYNKQIEDLIIKWYSYKYIADFIWISKSSLFNFVNNKTNQLTNKKFLDTLNKINLYFNKK